jgi:hypothetical protein
MEKLETFFINTVIEAQQQAQPTSGAVSTTQIGDFLAAGERKEDVLDKLVSASAPSPSSSIQATDADGGATQRPQPRETVTPEPDRNLLSKLTQPAVSADTEQVVPPERAKTEPVETESETQGQVVQKNVLDELTGHASPSDDEEGPEQKDRSKGGESGHA